MKMNVKSKKGITLITLVMIISVLLFLAGVSVSLFLGKNGVISNAKLAKEQTLKSQVLEEIKLKVAEILVNKQGFASLQDVKEALTLDPEQYLIWDSMDNQISVIYKGYKFNIDRNLAVSYDAILSPYKESNRFLPIIKQINFHKIQVIADPRFVNETENELDNRMLKYEFFINGEKVEQEQKVYSYTFEPTKQVISILAYQKDGTIQESSTMKINPIFSKNNTNITKIIASSNEAFAYKILDNDTSTYWDGGKIDSFIGYQFEEEVECNYVTIKQPYSSDVIKKFKIQYSDDNLTYQDASPILEFQRENKEQNFCLNANLGKHKYWRFFNLENYTTGNFCAISELDFYTFEKFEIEEQLIPALTKTHSTSIITNHNPESAYLAFDYNDNTYWDGREIDSFLGYQFEEEVECNHVTIKQPYSSDVIKKFKIQYSDDNLTYQDASPILEFQRENREQNFCLNANLGKHKYWRFFNLENYTTSNVCAISELEFYRKEK